MKNKFRGYDPTLGEKFFQDSSGLVIGRAASSPKKSEPDNPLAKYQDPQEAHDEAMPNPPAPPQRLPDVPKRSDFPSQEEYEEALGGWRSRVGKIKALAGGKKTGA